MGTQSDLVAVSIELHHQPQLLREPPHLVIDLLLWHAPPGTFYTLRLKLNFMQVNPRVYTTTNIRTAFCTKLKKKNTVRIVGSVEGLRRAVEQRSKIC